MRKLLLVTFLLATSLHADVGTMKFTWTDSSRNDPVTASPRRVVVQIWYPAKRNRAAKPAPYIMELEALRADLQTRLKFEDPSVLGEYPTPASLDVPPSKGAAMPVILFSHGFGTPRSMYTTFVRGLAEKGYFVAAIDHPGMGVAVVDDKLVTPYRLWAEVPPGLREKPEEERDRHWLPQRLFLSADQRFVLDTLARMNESDATFKGRLDLKRVAMIGHSRGFLSPTCASDPRIRACVNLNGVPALAERRGGLAIPFLTVRAERGDDERTQTTIFQNMRAPAFDVLVEGSHHSSVTDRDLFAPHVKDIAGRRLSAISAVVVAFLDETLRGRPNTLERALKQYAEVRLTRYPAPAAGAQ